MLNKHNIQNAFLCAAQPLGFGGENAPQLGGLQSPRVCAAKTGAMPGFVRRVCAIAAVLGVVAGAHTVGAAPHATVAPLRPVVVGASRSTGAHVLRGGVAPIFGFLAVRHAFAPIHALPLSVRPQPVNRLSLLLPQIGWAALVGPVAAGKCTDAGGPVRIAVIPTTPVFSDRCAHRSLDDVRDLPPTSLVSGHNKNALYGRAYSPTGDDVR